MVPKAMALLAIGAITTPLDIVLCVAARVGRGGSICGDRNRIELFDVDSVVEVAFRTTERV